jgi:hypothetical protein
VVGRHKAEEAAEVCDGGGRGHSRVAGQMMHMRAPVGRRWAEEVEVLVGGGVARGVGGSIARPLASGEAGAEEVGA